jgi:hypothetical protein
VVETGGLENRFTLAGNGGSNPSPSAIYRFQNILRSPRKIGKPQQTLRFTSFVVRWRLVEAGLAWGYIWGYFDFRQGVFFRQGAGWH